MRNEISFTYNWNNKLAGKFFTTLRLKNDSKYFIGETYSIYLKKKLIFYAEIVTIKHFHLSDINDYVAGLDTGYSTQECRNIIKTMYKNIDWDKRLLSLILLRKLNNSNETAKNHSHPFQQTA